MKTVTKIAAQGDVLFLRVDSVPDGYEPSDDHIIAHSDTGHNHVASGDLQVMRNADDAMRTFLVAKGDVDIVHHRSFDTHEPLRLIYDCPPAGEVVWEIRRQREHTPEGWRRVED